MANTSIEIEIKALDNATKALRKIEKALGPISKKVDKMDKEFDKVDKTVNRLGGSFTKLKGLLGGAIAVGGLTAFTKATMDSYGAAQDLKVALETVTGSAAEADKAFGFIRDFTEKTPFQVENVSEAFVKLKNAGIEPTAELLTTLGDAAAVSTDKVGALTAIADLYSRTVQGGLGVEELDRLQDRGIPVYDILSEKLKIARQDVSEFGKTAEGAAKVTQALTEGFEERFGGGMARASETLNGRISTLKDTLDGFLIRVGEGGLGDAIQTAVEKFTDFIKTNEELALKIGEVLGKAIVGLTDGIIFLFENAEKAKPIFDLLGTVFSEVVAPAAVAVFDILVKVAEALNPLIEKAIPLAQDVFRGLGGVMTDVVIPAFELVIGTIGKVIDKVESMINFIGAGINKVKEFGGAVGNKVGAGFNRAGDAIGGWVDSGKENIQGFYDWAVGNSVIPDLVNDIGKYMDMLPKKMVDPIKTAVDKSRTAFSPLPTQINPNSLVSPVQGVGADIPFSTGGNANANLNFNISGVNAGGAGQFDQAQMRQYIEGVALQVATSALRQNTRLGGLI